MGVHHKDWSQITQKDNLLSVDHILYKMDDFINNHTPHQMDTEKSCFKEVEMMIQRSMRTQTTLQQTNNALLEININGPSLVDSTPDKTLFNVQTRVLKTHI